MGSRIGVMSALILRHVLLGPSRRGRGRRTLTDTRKTMHEAATGCVCGTNRGASLYTRDLLDGYRDKEAQSAAFRDGPAPRSGGSRTPPPPLASTNRLGTAHDRAPRRSSRPLECLALKVGRCCPCANGILYLVSFSSQIDDRPPRRKRHIHKCCERGWLRWRGFT